MIGLRLWNSSWFFGKVHAFGAGIFLKELHVILPSEGAARKHCLHSPVFTPHVNPVAELFRHLHAQRKVPKKGLLPIDN